MSNELQAGSELSLPRAIAEQRLVMHRRTRHERKMLRNAVFAAQASDREKWEREHPVLSGKVKVTDYVPPPGRYIPAYRHNET